MAQKKAGMAEPRTRAKHGAGRVGRFARVVKLVNTLASGASAEKAWEFESPPGHSL